MDFEPCCLFEKNLEYGLYVSMRSWKLSVIITGRGIDYLFLTMLPFLRKFNNGLLGLKTVVISRIFMIIDNLGTWFEPYCLFKKKLIMNHLV